MSIGCKESNTKALAPHKNAFSFASKWFLLLFCLELNEQYRDSSHIALVKDYRHILHRQKIFNNINTSFITMKYIQCEM